jgi:hypothetical protein
MGPLTCGLPAKIRNMALSGSQSFAFSDVRSVRCWKFNRECSHSETHNERMQLGIHYFDSVFLTCLTLGSWAFTPMSESKPCDSVGVIRLHLISEPVLYCSVAPTVIICFVQRALQWLIVSTDERGLYLTGTPTIVGFPSHFGQVPQ